MYYSSGAENHFSNDADGNDSSMDDENLDSSDKENTVWAYSCNPGDEEVVLDDSIDADDLFTVYVGIEAALYALKSKIFEEKRYQKIGFSTSTLTMCWSSCTIPLINLMKRL